MEDEGQKKQSVIEMSYSRNAPETQSRSDLHKAALDFAKRGIPVFPVRENGKEPLPGSRGFKDETTSIEQIDAWWSENPNYNLAIRPQNMGCAVIDPDGEPGLNAWAALELEHGNAPDTYTVRTPGGGLHLYFKGDLPPSQSALADHIDTRGGGSYALVPPSRLPNGVYRVERDIEPAPLPAWVFERLEAARRAKAIKLDTDVELDAPSNVGRAIAFAKNAAPSVEGEMGDKTAYVLACDLLSLGLSPEKALEIMLDHWNDRCEPPWDEAELQTKVNNAARYSQNDSGAWAVESSDVTFGPALDKLAKTDAEARPNPRCRQIVLPNEAIQDARPPTRWLVDGLLPEASTASVQAPFGSYKSFVATDLALAVASGKPAFGRFQVRRSGPVVYMMGEGLAGFESQRRPAWRVGRGIAPDVTLPIFTIDGVPPVRSAEEVGQYIAAVRSLGEKPALIIVDTFSRSMAGLNENDAGDANLYLDMADELVREFGCCVLTVMHEGKDESRGARGSTATPAGHDVVWKLSADQERRTARLAAIKLKDEEPPEPIHLQGRIVPLPNGKTSLVFDRVASDDYARAEGKSTGITRSEVGRALIALGATDGSPVVTRVLATQIAGPVADTKVVHAKERDLRRGAADKFSAYVIHHGQGRGDPTLWTYAPDAS